MKKIRFAENLVELRKSNDLSQKALGNKLGVDQRTISAWEKKICEPSYDMLGKICDFFNESFDSLLT